MSSKDASTPGFSEHDKELALKAIQTSTELLRKLEHARNHIERAFRVQIEQNSQGIPVSQDDADALEYLRTKLTTIKGTILYDRFFPTMFFSQRLSIERKFSPENADTYAKLKRFTERYTLAPAKEELDEFGPKAERTPVKTFWAEETLVAIEKFANFDSVDFRTYLKAKSPQGVSDDSISEEGSRKISDLSSETLVLGAKGKLANSGLTANNMTKLNSNGIGALSPRGRTKTKSKLLFKNAFLGSLKRTNSKASNSEFVEQSKAILDRCERLG